MTITKLAFNQINGNVVSVLDYGADPTGVADSTAAIQAAIDANQGKVVRIPAGEYKITSTLYTGEKGTVIGDGANKTILNITHSGVGMETQNNGSQIPYTRHQKLYGFTLKTNVNTTYALWVRKALYCLYEDIKITCPEATGSSFVAFRVGGSNYLNTFINCISDTEEETANQHGGKGWWIGNGENEEGSIFAACNENTLITCRGVRADVGFDLDACGGTVMINCGPEVCTTAGIDVRGDYNHIIGPWLEGSTLKANQFQKGDGAGGFSAPANPVGNKFTTTYPTNVEINACQGFYIEGSNLDDVTLNSGAFSVYITKARVTGTLTDNSNDSNLEYLSGGIQYHKIKNGASLVYDVSYGNANTQINLNNNHLIQSRNFNPLELSSGSGVAITGSSPFIRMEEMTDPGSSPANQGFLFLEDNGSGKTRLVIRFSSGASQVIATQP